MSKKVFQYLCGAEAEEDAQQGWIMKQASIKC
jgi:hypothetical protein